MGHTSCDTTEQPAPLALNPLLGRRVFLYGPFRPASIAKVGETADGLRYLIYQRDARRATGKPGDTLLRDIEEYLAQPALAVRIADAMRSRAPRKVCARTHAQRERELEFGL